MFQNAPQNWKDAMSFSQLCTMNASGTEVFHLCEDEDPDQPGSE
tara:strand:+ start:426 stop:557 length:132 start_codon:yes stop_codon:yes gene_type:complete